MTKVESDNESDDFEMINEQDVVQSEDESIATPPESNFSAPGSVNGREVEVKELEQDLAAAELEEKSTEEITREEFYSCTSIARCPSSVLITDFKYNDSKKPLNLEIPCPTCKDGDCFWHCGECFQLMQYDPSGMVFCECGGAAANFYEYRCKNSKHGEKFVKYSEVELHECLLKLNSVGEKNILVLGMSGVGKSTWINAFANYLTYETLEDALESELIYLVPTEFSITDANYEEVKISIGEETEQEQFVVGESATRSPKIHSFAYKGGRLNIIDTPGVGDTRGLDTDKANFSETLNYIGRFKEIHAICILLKSNEARLNTLFVYCLNQLFLHLHRNALKNVIFCFTHSQGTMFKPGATLPALRSFFGEMQAKNGIEVELNAKNMFCMDNQAFCYLCAKQQKIELDEDSKNVYVEAWNKSRRATYQLIDYVFLIQPHSADETVALFNARRIVLGLVKPLALITKQIQENIARMEQQKSQIQELAGNEKYFRSLLTIRTYHIQPVQLTHTQVTCKACSVVRKDSYGIRHAVNGAPCCKDCISPLLYFCTTFNLTGDCKRCGCSIDHHERTHWSQKEITLEEEDPLVKQKLDSVGSEREAKMLAMKKLSTQIEQYKYEQKEVNQCAARFTNFLQFNSIILHSDAIEDYLRLEIENAELSGQQEQVVSKVPDLRRVLGDYVQAKEFISKNVANSNADSFSYEFTANEVFQLRDRLFALPLSGLTIKSMLECELAGEERSEHNQGYYDAAEHRKIRGEKVKTDTKAKSGGFFSGLFKKKTNSESA